MIKYGLSPVLEKVKTKFMFKGFLMGLSKTSTPNMLNEASRVYDEALWSFTIFFNVLVCLTEELWTSVTVDTRNCLDYFPDCSLLQAHIVLKGLSAADFSAPKASPFIDTCC